MVINKILYDSVVLTKDTGDIRDLPIDVANEKQRKTELTSNKMFLKSDKSWFDYRET